MRTILTKHTYQILKSLYRASTFELLGFFFDDEAVQYNYNNDSSNWMVFKPSNPMSLY